jgi:competence protein ComEA
MSISRLWTPLTILLVVIIAVSGIFAWSRYRAVQAKEISISDNHPSEKVAGEIYIGGIVANPGFYPLEADDGINSLIQAAGGVAASTGLNVIKLYISETEEEETPQKINLNRAEVWLLEALPGIGEERAQAILDYRLEHGLFCNINEVTRVNGIGTKTFEQIKPLITVAD